MATTTNYAGLLPTVGGSEGTWGAENNALHQLWDAELFKAVYRDGSRGFTGAQAFAAGSAAAPGLWFSGDANTGLYWVSADSLAVSLGGTARATFATTGLTLSGGLSCTTISPSGLVAIPASVAGAARLNLAQGAVVTSPVNGDVWTTDTGLFVRINGTTHNLLSVGGVWATARSIAFSGGDVTGNTGTFNGSANVTGVALSIANGAVTTGKIADGAVSLGKIANIGAGRLLGNVSGGSAAPAELTVAQVVTLLAGSLGAGLAANEINLFGLYLKWGSGTVTSAGSGTAGELAVSFANAFPASFQGAVATPVLASGAVASTVYAPYVRNPSAAGMSIGIDDMGSSGSFTVHWLAWGK